MRRLSLVIALSVVAMTVAPASALDFHQKSFYAHGLLSLPTGDYGDFANVGFGPGIGMLVPHDAMWSFRGEISFIFYSTDDPTIPGGSSINTSAREIPLLVLAQYNLNNSPGYLLGGLGLAFGHASIEYNDPLFGQFSVSDNSTDLDLALGGGYALSPQVALEGRFNIISDANQFTFHGVYHF